MLSTKYIYHLWQEFLQIIFPIKCLNCHKEKYWICPDCLKKIELLEKSYTKTKLPPLKQIIITTSYKNPLINKAIINFKYNFIQDLQYPLAYLMAKQLATYKYSHLITPKTILIPVPLHKNRLNWRGFNQASLLAKNIGHNLKTLHQANTLIRTQWQTPQEKIKDAYLRHQNIQNAFAINPATPFNYKNKNIILIDDVSTTGATLQACAQVLHQAGTKNIYALVLARG